MKSFGLLAVLAAAFMAAPVVYAQQSAAPAGSNGQCKDGTYSSAASKKGACRGHQGVKEWYSTSPASSSASTTSSSADNSATTTKKSRSKKASTADTAAAAPAAAAAAPAAPAAAAPAAAAPQKTSWFSRKPATTAPAAAPATAAAAGGGAGQVWVNSSSKVYHCQGDPWYGKTKKGEYMSEAAAKAAGDHASAGKACS